jgi:hypothetical protein
MHIRNKFPIVKPRFIHTKTNTGELKTHDLFNHPNGRVKFVFNSDGEPILALVLVGVEESAGTTIIEINDEASQ